MKQIQVKFTGLWGAEPVTCQVFDEDELIYCDHAGAETEEQDDEVRNPDSADFVWTRLVDICDKCNATKIEGDDWWQDAPVNGVNYDLR